MVGHLSIVGELVLEKAHQSLKRAISQSNNKDIQLQSMNSVIFSDWHARLSMFAHGALEADEKTVIGFYRLLSGRESTSTMIDRVSASHRDQVRRALGPPCCVPALLVKERRSVISPRAQQGLWTECSWILDREAGGMTLSSGLRGQILELLQQYGLVDCVSTVQFGSHVRATANRGISLLSIKAGNVLEVLTYRPSDEAFHIPLIVHRNNVGPEFQEEPEGLSIWSAAAFFRKICANGKSELWAVLHPCRKSATEGSTRGLNKYSALYSVSPSICFVEVSTNLRKVGKLHDCSPGLCRPVQYKSEIDHNDPSLPHSTSFFYVRGRCDGFPPRQG